MTVYNMAKGINRITHILRMTGNQKDVNTLFKYFGFDTKKDVAVDDDGAIKFITANYTPYKSFEEVSRKYPKIKFSLMFADEDLGNNVGAYIIKNGERLKEYVPKNGSLEAYRLAMDITENYYYLEDYMFYFNEDDAGEEFPELLLELAYQRGILHDEYPEFVLNRFMGWALRDSNYEMAAIIRDKTLVTLN